MKYRYISSILLAITILLTPLVLHADNGGFFSKSWMSFHSKWWWHKKYNRIGRLENKVEKLSAVVEQLLEDNAALQEQVSQLSGSNSELQTQVSQLNEDNAALQAEIVQLMNTDTDLDTRVAKLESNPGGSLPADTKEFLDDLQQYVSIRTHRSWPTVFFSGVNVHIDNGAGQTDSLNGIGNLIVGYNELSLISLNKFGSHNLIVGRGHNYSTFGSVVFGRENSITGEFSVVSGGSRNRASGLHASVSGGTRNTAAEATSSISGGRENTASGRNSSVSGGVGGTTLGESSSISGGSSNTASGSAASVSGGELNTASGDRSSISGGDNIINSNNDRSVHAEGVFGPAD